MRLQKIDESNRADHYFLDDQDDCYYVLEYTPRQGPHHSSTNDLIINLKKPVDRRGRPEYRYKEWAIRQAGTILRSVLSEEYVTSTTWVPVPCSKTRQHPLYDDRMSQVLQYVTENLQVDVRELVVQTQDLEGFHDGCRLRPEELLQHYELDLGLCAAREPSSLAVVDDLLTTGSHFKAASAILRDRWPDVPIAGIFVARRYIPAPQPANGF